MLYLLVPPFVFFLSVSGATGQEGCIVPTIPKNVKGIESLLALQWDPDNPDEIDRGESKEVKVTGGSLPLEWSVSGTGFSLEDVQTGDRTNTLQASSSACGTATITVTDGWGTTVTGYVRCTAGGWVLKSYTCEMPGHGKNLPGNYGRNWELVSGGRKQLQSIYKHGAANMSCEWCGSEWLCYQCGESGSCSEVSCQPCIDYYAPWGDYLVPYIQYEDEHGIHCNYYSTTGLEYHEWECP